MYLTEGRKSMARMQLERIEAASAPYLESSERLNLINDYKRIVAPVKPRYAPQKEVDANWKRLRMMKRRRKR